MENAELNISKNKLVTAITEAIKIFDEEVKSLVTIEKIEVNFIEENYQDLIIDRKIKVIVSARL